MIRTTTVLIFHLIGQIQNEWDVIETGITEHLHDIEFVNENTCFIYSYGTGNIYQTKEKGDLIF